MKGVPYLSRNAVRGGVLVGAGTRPNRRAINVRFTPWYFQAPRFLNHWSMP